MNLKKIFFICFFCFCLCSCTKDTKPTDTVANSAKESVNAIVAVKPECKDVGTVCNSQIDSITATCNLELDDLNKDVFKWKWSFFGLLIVLGVYLIKKVLK